MTRYVLWSYLVINWMTRYMVLRESSFIVSPLLAQRPGPLSSIYSHLDQTNVTVRDTERNNATSLKAGLQTWHFLHKTIRKERCSANLTATTFTIALLLTIVCILLLPWWHHYKLRCYLWTNLKGWPKLCQINDEV